MRVRVWLGFGILLLSASALVTVVAAPGAAASVTTVWGPPRLANDTTAIRDARVAQNAAILAHDTDRVASFWTDDVQITRGLGAVLQGRAAYQKLFVGDTVTYQRIPDDISVSAAWPLAFETGHWEGRTPSGKVPAISGRYSAQWVKRNGRWLIHSEVFVALGCSGAMCQAPLSLPR